MPAVFAAPEVFFVRVVVSSPISVFLPDISVFGYAPSSVLEVVVLLANEVFMGFVPPL